jgi:hypothetical protein
MPGNGAGVFGAPVFIYSYNSGTAPGNGGIPSIASIADLNTDGYPDLLAINRTFAVVNGVGVTTTTLQVYPGKVDGTFAAPTTAITSTILGALAVADFNKDGKLDLAVLAETSTSQAQLLIALGKGDGTFGTPATLNLAGEDAIRSAGLSAADFDNDGNIDLALIDNNDYSGVFYGKGDDTFTSVPFNGYIIPKDRITIAVGSSLGAISIATDLNKDGKPDILAGNTALLNLYGSAPKVTQFATTVALTSSAGTITAGSSVTLTATITGAAGSTGTPTGPVTFLDGTTTLGTGTLSSGSATFTTTLAVGSHSLTAVYGGDINFAGNTSTAVTVTVNSATPIATTTALTSTATTAVSGTSITFTATVAASSGSAIPGGTVTFLDGTTTLSTQTLDSTGKAIYPTVALTVGSHSITAKYAGTASFVTSTSSAVAVTITTPPSPDFALSINPGSGSETKSSPASATLTVTPSNGFNSAATFACSGLPTGVACTFNPATVTPSGTAASTSTVTFTATASAAARPGPYPHHAPETVLTLGIGAWLLARKRSRRLLSTSLWTVLVIGALYTFSGCGGSGAKTTTSTVTITATSGSLSHTATYTLTATN